MSALSELLVWWAATTVASAALLSVVVAVQALVGRLRERPTVARRSDRRAPVVARGRTGEDHLDLTA